MSVELPNGQNASATGTNRASRTNRLVGWTSMAVGATTGLAMGLWSFNGPMDTPAWLGEYADVSRRLARLGHIAFFGLGILNVLLARELTRVTLSTAAHRLALATMNFGNIFLPVTLFAAAAYHPAKYLLPIPAMSVTVALVITAYAVYKQN